MPAPPATGEPIVSVTEAPELIHSLLGLGVIVEFGGYYSPLVQTTLGPGGAERIIVYPLLAWLMGFGGYLSGRVAGEKVGPGPG
jgi:hypothetical protein